MCTGSEVQTRLQRIPKPQRATVDCVAVWHQVPDWIGGNQSSVVTLTTVDLVYLNHWLRLGVTEH